MAEQVQQPATRVGLLGQMVTPALDVVTLLLVWVAVPSLTEQFARLDGLNPLIVTAGYVLLCVGVLLGNRLAPQPQGAPARPVPAAGDATKKTGNAQAESNAEWCARGLSVPFAIFVCVMLFETGGMFESHGFLSQLNDAAPGLVGTLGTLSVIIALTFFPLVTFWPRRPRVAWGSAQHALLKAIAVVCINAMVIITTAFWEYFMGDAELGEMAIGGKILVFICFYIVMLVFYAPPRLALVAVEPGRWGYYSFLVFLGVIVWRMMAGG